MSKVGSPEARLERQVKTLAKVFFLLSVCFAILLIIFPAADATPIMFGGFFAIATSLLIFHILRFRIAANRPLIILAVIFNFAASALLAVTLATMASQAFTR